MKTKAYLILFILCALLQKSKAQSYFNNRYDTFGSCDGTANLDTFNNHFLTAGFTCSAISFYALNLKQYNKNSGLVSLSKTYNWSGNNFANANGFIKNANKYLLGGTRFYHNDTSLVFQWIFNQNLDSVKYTEYGYLNKGNVINKIINYSNNSYFMTGQVYDNLYNSDILLIKTDTAGNEIWKKKIGVIGWDETAISIDTLNGNLLIAGNKMPHGTSGTYGFVMCLDTAANIIWQKTVVTNGGYGGCAVKKLKDGNVLIYSRIKQYSLGSDDYYKLQVEKITPSNITIWQKTYNAPQIYANPYSAIENKLGNIVIASQTGFYLNMINGKVNEINQNGDSLFTKEYAIMPGSQNYFRDVMQTSDGGYCFAGFANPLFSFGGTGTEDIWLLKVDSNFCESAVPCGYGVGIDEKTYVENGIKVYPNPAKNVLHIELVDFNNEPYTIEISNELGQVVLSQAVSSNLSSFYVQHLPNGMYFLTLKMKDKKVVKKIIIQY